MSLLFFASLFPFFGFGFQLCRRVSRSTQAVLLVFESLPFAIAAMILSIGLIGRMTQHFTAAVFTGSALCLAGLAWLRCCSKPAPLERSFAFRREDIPLLAVLSLSTLFVGMVIFKYAIYDEMRLQGHIAVVESILRGSFPPSYTAFPDIPYRYHYAFNLLAAYFSKAFGVPGYLGMDLVAALSWIALVPLLLILLRRCGVPRPMLGLAFAFVALTGGLSWLISRNDLGAGAVYQLPHWQQMFVMSRGVHPHFMMYFFQHPMGLGLGLFLAALLYLQDYWARASWRELFCVLAFLGALSLAQVMLFITLLAAIGIVLLLRLFAGRTSRGKIFAQGVFLGLGSLGIALALGGFFRFSSQLENQPILFSWPPSYLRYEYWGARRPLTWGQGFVWYLSGFGWSLFAIPAAWTVAVRRGRGVVGVLAVFCALCFGVPLFFRYAYSWDIIKWYFGFEFSGKLLACWAFLPWIARSGGRIALAWACVLFGMVTPMRFLGELALKPHADFTRAELRIAGFTQPRLQGAFAELLERLKSGPRGSFWSSQALSEKISQFSGLPSLQMDRNTLLMPVSRSRIESRARDVAELEVHPSLDSLRKLGARWLVYACGELPRLDDATKAFLESLRRREDVELFEFSRSAQDCYQAFLLK